MTKEIQQETIRGIALRAKALGGRAMLVGGCVRDALTGRESADIDCEVYGLAPQALRSLAAAFGEVDESGARYGIFSLKGAGIDLAVPRLERRSTAILTCGSTRRSPLRARRRGGILPSTRFCGMR